MSFSIRRPSKGGNRVTSGGRIQRRSPRRICVQPFRQGTQSKRACSGYPSQLSSQRDGRPSACEIKHLSSSDMQSPDVPSQQKHRVLHTHAFDFWLARAAVIIVVALQFLLVNDFSLGPRWLAPAVELLLLAPLSVATAWVQNKARQASTEAHFYLIARSRRLVRRAALGLTMLVTVMNFIALYFLIRALLGGHAGPAQSLLIDAVNIWCTNVIAFALWFWGIDRGGPASRGLSAQTNADFLFPQMSLPDQRFQDWSPGLVDYLFLSFTNATAFSPTDTMPLSPRAKLLMMAEAAISLLTIALVAARAVNILA
ncbi:hypothetical protein [Rhizobium sp. 2YAF20]|uniref:hypothetical protein n=1 Tax=Rhizobium sp. 2YAF20 TaxID=3233027 RepID=UPI003F97B745